MKMVDFYLESGGAYQEVFSRLPNDSLILKFINKFKDDETYGMLLDAIEKENYEEAFRASHTLKGLCMTLGFGTLGGYISEMTELLREYKEESKEKLNELLYNVRNEYKLLINNIDKIKA